MQNARSSAGRDDCEADGCCQPIRLFDCGNSMQKPIITSLSNPLIKQARALRQKKARLESRLFLVEGIHHVGEAIEAGWNLEAVLYAPELLTSRFANDLIARHSSVPQPVSAQVMESLADKENPQGIVAIVRQRQTRISDLNSP